MLADYPMPLEVDLMKCNPKFFESGFAFILEGIVLFDK